MKKQQDTLEKFDRHKTGNALIILTIIIHPSKNNQSVTLRLYRRLYETNCVCFVVSHRNELMPLAVI